MLWSQAFGRLDADAESAPTQQSTIFDLASLTKVIATTTLVMRLVERGALALDHPIRKWIREWRGNDREDVTVRALLTHSSGLSAWLPFFRDYTGRQEFQHAIASLPLEYRPDTQSIYSDLGFMLLGFIIEDAGGRPFASQAAEVLASVTSGAAHVQSARRAALVDRADRERPVARTAARRRGPRRKLLGAWRRGGARRIVRLCDRRSVILRERYSVRSQGGRATGDVPRRFDSFVARYSAATGSRALGWDTMLPTSSCGTKISPAAFGHTGFTGTSLWIDPERDLYVVFLTNRVNPTRENTAIQQIRPALHDAVLTALA